MPATIYRLQCCICPATTDAGKRTGSGKKPKGWTIFFKIRSAKESYRLHAKPGETDFDPKMHWHTHYGMCDECGKRMNKVAKTPEEKAAWVNENKKF